MAAIVKELWKLYCHAFNELQNPQSKDWPLMHNPVPVLAILAGYLYFVLKAGPEWMEKRQPFKLDRVLQLYNLVQIFACAYVVQGIFLDGLGTHYSLRCQPMDWSDKPEAVRMTGYMYFYFLVKLADLLDTVFFVLRKKHNQISFLHVYHHAGMVALTWGGSQWAGNGQVVMIPFLNSIVHMVMYFYYFLTSVSDSKKFMWWKKHITQLQIAQFFCLIIHFGQLLFHNPCNFPIFYVSVILPQNVFMLFLFFDFYIKAYIKKKQ